MLHTEGRGFISRLSQGLSLACSRWSDIIGSSLRGRGGGLSNLDRRITSASDTWSYGSQARGCGLEKAYHSTGSLDPTGAARDGGYAVDLIAWGGN